MHPQEHHGDTTHPATHRFQGQTLLGVYSVSGSLMIARIPGIGSKSSELAEEEETTAKALLTAILEEAEDSGRLAR